MAIDFIQKQWKDFPDQSTPITATELNRLENVIGEMAEEFQTQTIIAKAITQFMLCGISALYPEYTMSTFTEAVETEEDTTMTVKLDLSVYNPDNADGLLITADGILVSLSAYTVAVENNSAVIRFGTSAGLEIGQTVDFYIYHKPETSTNTTGQAILMLTGTNESEVGNMMIIEEEET